MLVSFLVSFCCFCLFHVGSLHICLVQCHMSTVVFSSICVRLSRFNESYLLTYSLDGEFELDRRRALSLEAELLVLILCSFIIFTVLCMFNMYLACCVFYVYGL